MGFAGLTNNKCLRMKRVEHTGQYEPSVRRGTVPCSARGAMGADYS